MQELNRRLEQVYGRDLLRRPFFRLVWSESQIEKRYGNFNVFYGQIFVREEFGVDLVPKYPWIKPPTWVLERLLWLPEGVQKELVPQGPDRGVYEPIWTFHGIEDRKTVAVPPNWEACQRIITCMRNPHKTCQADVDQQEDQEIEREIKLAMDRMDNEMPDIVHAIETGTAVAFGGVKKYEGDSNQRDAVRPGRDETGSVSR